MMSFKRASFLLVLFPLAFILSNASQSPAELYWKMKLGNTPMPKVLQTSLFYGSSDGMMKLNSPIQQQQHAQNTDQIDIKYGVYINYAHPTADNQDGSQHIDQVNVQYGVYINYAHPKSDDQDVKNIPSHPTNKLQVPKDGRVVYFTTEKLQSQTKIKLHFNNVDNGAKFLPLNVAKSLVVAPNKSEIILNALSLNPKSIEARYIKKMLQDCNDKGIKDEVRHCANSLEDMVDFITSSSTSGNNNGFRVVSTEQEKDVLMEYTVQNAQKLGNDDKHTVVCHKLYNPYVVFLCHNIQSTDVYGVSLVGADGKQMKAIAVCHKDTSNWYSGHLALQLLNLKPGDGPICHFLSGDTTIWLQK